jgi:hypothetical protein
MISVLFAFDQLTQLTQMSAFEFPNVEDMWDLIFGLVCEERINPTMLVIRFTCKHLSSLMSRYIVKKYGTIKPSIKNKMCAKAAASGNLNLLRWIRALGFEWNVSTCNEAAKNGHLKILKWAREKGCGWDSLTTYFAAINGHLDILKWALGNNCPRSRFITEIAAANRHWNVLKWMYVSGCKNVLKCAIARDNVEMIKWLHEKGYRWSNQDYQSTIAYDGLKIIKWLLANIPCDWSTYQLIVAKWPTEFATGQI